MSKFSRIAQEIEEDIIEDDIFPDVDSDFVSYISSLIEDSSYRLSDILSKFGYMGEDGEIVQPLGVNWRQIISKLEKDSRYKSQNASEKIKALLNLDDTKHLYPEIYDAAIRDFLDGGDIYLLFNGIKMIAYHVKENNKCLPELLQYPVIIIAEALKMTKEQLGYDNNSSPSSIRNRKRLLENIKKISDTFSFYSINLSDKSSIEKMMHLLTFYPRLLAMARSTPTLYTLLMESYIGKVDEDIVLEFLRHFPNVDKDTFSRVTYLSPYKAEALKYFMDIPGFVKWLVDKDTEIGPGQSVGHKNFFEGLKRIYGNNLTLDLVKRFIHNPYLVGRKLSEIASTDKRVEEITGFSANSAGRNYNRLVAVFGSNIFSWLGRFDPYRVMRGGKMPVHLNPYGLSRAVLIDRIIHDAAQILPDFTNKRQVRGLDKFLFASSLNSYTRMIAQNWLRLESEEIDLLLSDPDIAIPKILTRLLSIPEGKEHLRDLYLESHKWGVSPQMSVRHRIDGRLHDTSLEELYQRSLQVSLPAWASVSATISGYTGRFLPRDDARGLYLGQYTNCCQHPTGEGASCSFHGQCSPYGAFFVVEDKSGEPVAQSWVWQSTNGGVVFDNVEAKGLGSRDSLVRAIYREVSRQMVESGLAKFTNIGVGGVGSDLSLEGLEETPRAKAKGGLRGVYTDADKQRRMFPEASTIIKLIRMARTMDLRGNSEYADTIDRRIVGIF